MLAEELGNNQWLVAGPLIFVLALAAWITLVIHAVHGQRRYGEGRDFQRGPVAGGIIEGSPSQRNRRDEAPRHDSKGPSLPHRPRTRHL
ncbi:hypothetical protein [Actinomadura alba]|uniref:Uncharacterized protein n=1 Tax=Actinomadura alba TaxID=406431 RepID=A0ABR7M1P1_9ACTN|nr:hypothetical protein [Actinomadura alba]MBC6471035.1 hypothetical protein [Actinomadura alba]